MDEQIVMYARERYCPDVERTRTRLTALDLAWTEHDIEGDSEAATTVQALTGQRRVPTLLIGDTVLVEPSDTELDDALAKAGLIHATAVSQGTA
jgi:glutaredoxin